MINPKHVSSLRPRMLKLLAGTSNERLIDALSDVRHVDVPFAVPNQLYRVAEADIVQDVLHALQGNAGETIQWSKPSQQFQLKPGIHVSHLSQCSLGSLVGPFLSAATCLRRVDKFITKSSRLVHRSKYPTLEAFANVTSIRLKHLRASALALELAAVAERTITLLKLFANLSWLCAGAEFLDHVVRNAVPQHYATLPAAKLSSQILSFLFESLNKFCLLKDGEDEGYRTLLMFFVGTLWPYIQTLDDWLHEGSLADPCGEMYFYANSAITIQDSSFWQSGFFLRYVNGEAPTQTIACPSFLEELAKPILSSGKSLQLLQHVQRECGKTLSKTAAAQVPLFDQLCSSLKKLVVQRKVTLDPKSDHYSLLASKVSMTAMACLMSNKTTSELQVWEECQVHGSNELKETTCQDIFASSTLPSLDDTELRKALYAETDEADNEVGRDSPAECTNFFCGDGCGGILRSQILGDRKALRKLFSSPTSMPVLKESGVMEALPYHRKNMEAPAMLQWLQLVDLTTTPSSAVIVQDCLVSFIEKQVNAVGSELLEKLMGEWHLMEEITLLRAIYLMGSGDLLQQFSFVLFNKLDRGEPWDDFYELNTMLQESLRSSADAALYSTIDSLVLKMDFRGNTPHPVQLMGRNSIHSIDVLDSLQFEYKVAWPLELIIDSDAINKYNQVMCFLLKVKRAKQALDKACRWMWKGDSGFHKEQLLLQMKLMHFVNTLHHYVMDQVLYSSWVELCEGMTTARSLDEVISCHDTYLISIQRQCFVAPDKLWTLISGRVKTILGLALDFYSIQRTLFGGRAGATAAATCQQEIDRVAKQFDECIAFLLRVLSFKLNVGHFPHLTDLITRINYNNFYISESGQLLAPIPDLQPRGRRSLR